MCCVRVDGRGGREREQKRREKVKERQRQDKDKDKFIGLSRSTERNLTSVPAPRVSDKDKDKDKFIGLSRSYRAQSHECAGTTGVGHYVHVVSYGFGP